MNKQKKDSPNHLELLFDLDTEFNDLDEIKEKLRADLKYDFILNPTKLNTKSGDKFNNKIEFGQFQTPLWIADLISDLSINNKSEKILEPCFGDGIFLRSISSRVEKIFSSNKPEVFGVELDFMQFILGCNQFLLAGNRKTQIHKHFFCGNVFEFDETGFDSIIFNPPYIRQEKLGSDGTFDKNEILSKISKNLGELVFSLRSNLYLYFIVYLSSLLKEGGTIGAIIPKTWMDSEYGIKFQEFLLSNFHIEYIIDFQQDVFTEPIVEDCIIIIKKIKDNVKSTKFIHFKKNNKMKNISDYLQKKKNVNNNSMQIQIIKRKTLEQDHKWGKFLISTNHTIEFFRNDKLIKLSSVAKLSRGISTNWNEFFIIKKTELKNLKIEKQFLKPIITSPRKIIGYNTEMNGDYDYLLVIKKSLDEYNNSGFMKKYVKTRMNNNEKGDWYKINPKKGGSIFFSYIIRDKKNFIYNSDKIIVRDNFHNIRPYDEEPLILFSLLNSTFTKINLELIGRRYGNGMLKIQVYELADVMIPDVSLLTKKDRKDLMNVAKELSKCEFGNKKSQKLIKKIDLIVSKFYTDEYDENEIEKIEKKIIQERLARV